VCRREVGRRKRTHTLDQAVAAARNSGAEVWSESSLRPRRPDYLSPAALTRRSGFNPTPATTDKPGSAWVARLSGLEGFAAYEASIAPLSREAGEDWRAPAVRLWTACPLPRATTVGLLPPSRCGSEVAHRPGGCASRGVLVSNTYLGPAGEAAGQPSIGLGVPAGRYSCDQRPSEDDPPPSLDGLPISVSGLHEQG
jgi:hypothetical protein